MTDSRARVVRVSARKALRRASLEQHARCTAFDPRSTAVADSHFDFVIDAVGSAVTRNSAIAAVKPPG